MKPDLYTSIIRPGENFRASGLHTEEARLAVWSDPAWEFFSWEDTVNLSWSLSPLSATTWMLIPLWQAEYICRAPFQRRNRPTYIGISVWVKEKAPRPEVARYVRAELV